jgi:hypothetical protein
VSSSDQTSAIRFARRRAREACRSSWGRFFPARSAAHVCAAEPGAACTDPEGPTAITSAPLWRAARSLHGIVAEDEADLGVADGGEGSLKGLEARIPVVGQERRSPA